MKRWLGALLVLTAAACRAPTQVPVGNDVAATSPARSTVDASPLANPPTAERREAIPNAQTTAPVAVADGTIPVPVRGKWRQTDAATVTAAECREYDAPNMGKILVIGADRFNVFEEGGRLLTVHRRQPRRIRATFDTTYADTPTRADYDFDAQDDGQTLIVRVSGDGASAGPTRYVRCPA